MRIGSNTAGFVAALLLVLALVPTAPAEARDEDTSDGWVSQRFPVPRGEQAHVRDVVSGPDGFVAVGRSCTPRSRCTAAVWRSRTGEAWRRIDVDRRQRTSGDSVESGVESVAWGPGGYVAVGWSRPPMTPELAAVATEGPVPVAAVWRSRDGRHWRRVVTGLPFLGNPTPGDIAASGGRYLVLSPGRSMVVTSREGGTWVKRRTDISRQGGWLFRVEPLGDGYAAVGPIRTVEADGRRSCCSTAVWRSSDGRHWSPQVVAGEDSYLGRIAALGDRVVVVEGPGSADEYTRPRGGFTRVANADGTVEMGFVPGATGLHHVGAAGDRLVVAGQACGPALWTSPDGLDWTRAEWSGRLPGGADRWHDVDIAADDQRVVIAGSAEVERDGRPSRPPRLVDVTISTPLHALDVTDGDTADGSADGSADAERPCAPSGEMPTAQLTTDDGQVTSGALVEACWLTTSADGALSMDCQEAAKPAIDDLPVVAVGKDDEVTLGLSDGAPLAGATILEHHVEADVTSARRLLDTGACRPLDQVRLGVAGEHVLIVSVTFDCGLGGATYLFRTSDAAADE